MEEVDSGRFTRRAQEEQREDAAERSGTHGARGAGASRRTRRRKQVRRYVFDRRTGCAPRQARHRDERGEEEEEGEGEQEDAPAAGAIRRAIAGVAEAVHDTFCPEDVTPDYWTYAKVRSLMWARGARRSHPRRPRVPPACSSKHSLEHGPGTLTD